jgi:hypothetical protein
MKTKHIITFCLLLMLMGSCRKEFLTLNDPANLTVGDYFKTQKDFETAVNGIYANLRSYSWLGISEHADNLHFKLNPNNRGYVPGENEADFVPAVDRFSNFWNTYYEWIARANQVLDNIDDVTFDDAVKNNLKGQALFFRAYSYWWVVRVYDKAVLHLKSVNTVADTYKKASNKDDVMAQIIADATLASTLLEDKSSQEAGRVTSGTAKMLLADVYMWQKNWSAAETILKPLNSEFSLMPDYADVTDPAMKNNAESIFEIQYTNSISDYASGFTYGFFPFPMGADTLQVLTGVSNPELLVMQEGNLPTPDIISASILFVHNFDGILYPMCKRYLHKHTLLWQTDENMPIYRYAEALLFLAEAINEQGGRSSEALSYLNQIRNRAGLANSTASTQSDIRNAIVQERRVEFAFEGKRWFDLVRTGKAVEVMTAYGARVKANPQKYYYPGTLGPVETAYTNIATSFNIPESESKYNPSLKK